MIKQEFLYLTEHLTLQVSIDIQCRFRQIFELNQRYGCKKIFVKLNVQN